MQDDSTTGIGDKIIDFVQNNRKAIFTIGGIIIFLFAASLTYLFVYEYIQKKAITTVFELNEKLSNLQASIEEEGFSQELEELMNEIKDFAKGKRGYAGAKAWMMAAHVYSEKNQWEQAQDAWQNAASAGKKTYLASPSLFNAAACAEEQGNIEEAIELLTKCLALDFAFPEAPRAQFSIGRLNEHIGNTEAALEAYRVIMINWPSIEDWVNLAQSRIIALEAAQL